MRDIRSLPRLAAATSERTAMSASREPPRGTLRASGSPIRHTSPYGRNNVAEYVTVHGVPIRVNTCVNVIVLATMLPVSVTL